MANGQDENANLENKDLKNVGKSNNPDGSTPNNQNTNKANVNQGAVPSDPELQITPNDVEEDIITPLPPHINPFGHNSPTTFSRNLGFTPQARRAFKRFDPKSTVVQPCELWEYNDPRINRDKRF